MEHNWLPNANDYIIPIGQFPQSREFIQGPVITRSKKRKLLDDLVVLKMRNCSLNDIEFDKVGDGHLIPYIFKDFFQWSFF